MSKIRLTKNGLRDEQKKLTQLNRYLPTLKLKKAMLQVVVAEVRSEIAILEKKYEEEKKKADQYVSLLTDSIAMDITSHIKIKEVKRRYENIAGVDVPFFEGATFFPVEYNLFDTPVWIDEVVRGLEGLTKSLLEVTVAREKKEALEKELRAVSIRVNLFEKILIPRAEKNIKKIRVFLGDLQLSSVGQVKVAKTKIEQRKQQEISI